MALATLASVKPPLIQILNANRLAYAAVVGATAASRNAAYPYDQEITDALIRADGHIITEGYFHTRLALRNRFLTASANLANGATLPEFAGKIGKVEYSLDSIDWLISDQVNHQDAQSGAAGNAYVGANALAGHHNINEDEGVIYHTSPYCRIYYPEYTKTAVLQANDYHEPAIIAWALVFLYKDRSNAAFEHYTKLASMLLELIRTGTTNLPNIQPIGGE